MLTETHNHLLTWLTIGSDGSKDNFSKTYNFKHYHANSYLLSQISQKIQNICETTHSKINSKLIQA